MNGRQRISSGAPNLLRLLEWQRKALHRAEHLSHKVRKEMRGLQRGQGGEKPTSQK